jgi:hypothetical protein
VGASCAFNFFKLKFVRSAHQHPLASSQSIRQVKCSAALLPLDFRTALQLPTDFAGYLWLPKDIAGRQLLHTDLAGTLLLEGRWLGRGRGTEGGAAARPGKGSGGRGGG